MAQGTGGDIHTGHLVGDVTAQIGAVLVVRQELFDREEAPFRQGGIEARPGVTLAQYETVPAGPSWSGGIDAQNPAVQDCENVRAGEYRADMGPAAGAGHAQGVGTDTAGQTVGAVR